MIEKLIPDSVFRHISGLSESSGNEWHHLAWFLCVHQEDSRLNKHHHFLCGARPLILTVLYFPSWRSLSNDFRSVNQGGTSLCPSHLHLLYHCQILEWNNATLAQKKMKKGCKYCENENPVVSYLLWKKFQKKKTVGQFSHRRFLHISCFPLSLSPSLPL